MPCNLAVTITKAGVSQKELQALLAPDIVATVVESFINNHPKFVEAGAKVTSRGQFGGIIEVSLMRNAVSRMTTSRLNIGTMSTQNWMGVSPGGVQAVFQRNQDKASMDELAGLLQELVSRTADTLYAKKVKALLETIAEDEVEETQQVVKAGNQQMAVTMLKFEL